MKDRLIFLFMVIVWTTTSILIIALLLALLFQGWGTSQHCWNTAKFILCGVIK